MKAFDVMAKYFQREYGVRFFVRMDPATMYHYGPDAIVIQKGLETHILRGTRSVGFIYRWAEEVCRG